MIDGLSLLWERTLGRPSVRIAVLDGTVDTSHAALRGARLKCVGPPNRNQRTASSHGTHVASLIFGQHSGPIKGVAPKCSGIIIPVFPDIDHEEPRCTEADLARAIGIALQENANVINISGGRLANTGEAHPLLAEAVRACADRNVLIVSAAGNDGCDCLHVPGALDTVLAVGAMDYEGTPLQSSNWGSKYRRNGVLAPGLGILGAIPGGGTRRESGTSFSTAIVSGIAALLCCIQRSCGGTIDPHGVRCSILSTAFACDPELEADCSRIIGGRINIVGALNYLLGECSVNNESMEIADATQTSNESVSPQREATTDKTNDYAADSRVQAANEGHDKDVEVKPSGCDCGNSVGQLIYALGTLGYDLATDAIRDSFVQAMAKGTSPYNPVDVLKHLDNNPWDAESIIWTLNLDSTPVYAIRPSGPFASEAYSLLREFFLQQITEGVERVSIPGTLSSNIRLFNGQIVPMIRPNIRGMHSWTTDALVKAAMNAEEKQNASGDKESQAAAIRSFLQRVYHATRNLGVSPQDRALNYAATNAFAVARIFESAASKGLSLDRISVARSPISRPESDCWDIQLLFFNPTKLIEEASTIYQFAVDVSSEIPVTVGETRSWSIRQSL